MQSIAHYVRMVKLVEDTNGPHKQMPQGCLDCDLQMLLEYIEAGMTDRQKDGHTDTHIHTGQRDGVINWERIK